MSDDTAWMALVKDPYTDEADHVLSLATGAHWRLGNGSPRLQGLPDFGVLVAQAVSAETDLRTLIRSLEARAERAEALNRTLLRQLADRGDDLDRDLADEFAADPEFRAAWDAARRDSEGQ